MTAEQEREAVVAWLRDLADAMEATARSVHAHDAKFLRLGADIRRELANVIERGDHHLSRNPDNPRK